MSGGSYDYAFRYVDDMADRLSSKTQTPLRRAFAAHMKLVAKAMHDIEWEDRCDGADDVGSMREAMGQACDSAELSVLIEDAIAARDALVVAIGKASLTDPPNARKAGPR